MSIGSLAMRVYCSPELGNCKVMLGDNAHCINVPQELERCSTGLEYIFLARYRNWEGRFKSSGMQLPGISNVLFRSYLERLKGCTSVEGMLLELWAADVNEPDEESFVEMGCEEDDYGLFAPGANFGTVQRAFLRVDKSELDGENNRGEEECDESRIWPFTSEETTIIQHQGGRSYGQTSWYDIGRREERYSCLGLSSAKTATRASSFVFHLSCRR